ncbi:glycosyltransferase [Anaeromyxobacter soli]|uniref:glycosyltransferase n=1 Tax=Anaeromyxobacter soli TaxID=2922725 RepID=UPI001FAF3116|nr:glycosyltransferase [Anaeromyxobacter sp. SG29]
MKLAYMTASFPYGTGETFLISEIAALKSLGVELYVIPLYPRGSRRPDWDPDTEGVHLLDEGLCSIRVLLGAASACSREPLASARAVFKLLSASTRHAAKNLAVVPKALWAFRELERRGCEHLHVHWAATTASAGMVAAQLAGIPWSMSCHRWDIHENNLLAAKVHSAAFTRFISRGGQRDAGQLGAAAGRTHVIPMGTWVPPFVPPLLWPSGTPFRVLCPANLLPVKGHSYLLAACAELIAEGRDVELALAGDGPLRGELAAQARRAGIAGRVTFLGHLPRPELLRLYEDRRVNAVVLPSLDLGGGEHEGVPVSLMEAMAFGVPVLSTRTGSIPELLPDDLGLTVPQRNASALAERLRLLICDEQHYRSVGAMCRTRVREGCSVDSSAARLLALIRRDAHEPCRL